MRARKLLLLMALAGVISMAPGCSSETASTTTTRSSTVEPDYTAAEAYPAPPPQQTTTTTTSSSEPDSVLGAAAHLVGTIIMLPFRIIGLVV